MSLSESEFYEAGMSLPPDVRKHVALRLRAEAAVAYDALKADPSRAIPSEDARDRFTATWAARS